MPEPLSDKEVHELLHEAANLLHGVQAMTQEGQFTLDTARRILFELSGAMVLIMDERL